MIRVHQFTTQILTGAIFWSGIGAVVFGCRASEMCKFSGPGGFDVPIECLFDLAPRKIRIRGPVLENEALKIHER
jgi:hypothetical protein